jgi:uncharacterized protein YndB with AHSA1/START domain
VDTPTCLPAARCLPRDGQVVPTRTYPTDHDDLWEALTSAGRIPRWFLPITGDLRVGGRYQLEGNAGGVVEEGDQPHRFAITRRMAARRRGSSFSLTPRGTDATCSAPRP